MPSHLSSIGFQLESADDFQQLALKTCEERQVFKTAGDVVADPVLLNDVITKGGVVTGSFWLSGVVN